MLIDNYMYRPAAVYRIAGFFRRRTFANFLKTDFRGENVREFVTQCTTPTSAVSNCLKIDQKNSRKSPQKREIRESFLPRNKPAIRYILHLGTVRANTGTWNLVIFNVHRALFERQPDGFKSKSYPAVD